MENAIKPWQRAISKLGIESLTSMQTEFFNCIENNENIVLLSPTGSGKTLAFLLPLLEIMDPKQNSIEVLIITPSRELALQIESVFKSLGTNFKVNSCYGGHSFKTELNNFSSSPAILIGTPGRISDHIRKESFKTNGIQILILDEFDKSLELGFSSEMSFIISKLTNLKKRILSSATDIAVIPDFTGIGEFHKLNYLVEESKSNNLSINVIKSEDSDKLDCLFQLLCELGSTNKLVFCNHRDAVERISNHLSKAGVVNDYFHGGLDQSERERMLIRFRNGSSNVLITTDLASRGIDIPEISNIIHYQLPINEASYIHRNGRTARMNSIGSSFLILAVDEHIPDYIKLTYSNYKLTSTRVLPSLPKWETLYIGAGKKEKINKMDIVGFLFKQGGLEKDELGYIEVKDHCSYAAVKRIKIQQVLKSIQKLKIKNKKVKIEISY